MKRIFLVSFEVPPHATVEEMEAYVESAVRCFCGGMDPREPMFNLEKDSVTVQHVKKTLLR